MLPERLIPELVERLSPYVDWDPFLGGGSRTSYPVTSLYFDTLDLHSLFAKEAGWLARRRIRLRTYHPDFQPGRTLFFEIKRRHDFLVSKDRLPMSVSPADADVAARGSLRHLLGLAREGSEATAREALMLDAWFSLQPTTLVSYDRVAFVGRTDRNLRITVDRDLRGVWRPLGLFGVHPYRRCEIDPVLPRLMNYGTHQAQGPRRLSARAHVILELKFAHSIPTWLHQIIKSMSLARSAYSKYAVVARSLRPNLFEALED